MLEQPDVYPPPVVTLADLSDAVANILYVYGDDRCGWEEWCYEALYRAGRQDVKEHGVDSRFLRSEHMTRTRKAAEKLLDDEKKRVAEGNINRDRFVDWIVEHVIIAYRNYCNHKFKAVLIEKDSYAAKNTYW